MTAPKFYKPAKPVVRNQAAEIRRKRAIAKKPMVESETESPDEGEREADA